jgi:predicted RNA-binding Zn-ribbon protein involved in translation (DUF1610 family)
MKINGVEVVKPENFETYCRWLGRKITAGEMLVFHLCPHCKARLHVSAPACGDVSDSLANCPVCDGLFFRVVDNRSDDAVVTTSIQPMIS